MDQNQLDVRFRQSADDSHPLWKSAGCTAPQHALLELFHQGGNVRGSREREVVFADIHLPILTGPFVYAAKPSAVTLADVRGGELMRLAVLPDKFLHRLRKGPGLRVVHVLL